MAKERERVAPADWPEGPGGPRSVDLDAFGNLASGIAHELRNPLNTVSLALQYLQSLLEQREVRLGLDLEDHFRKIHFELGKMRKILDNFTRFRPSAGIRLEKTELRTVIARALAETSQDCRRAGIEVRDAFPEGLVAMADPTILAEAVVHVIDNAVEAMPEGGVLSVEGGTKEGMHHVRIRDTGLGIPEGSEQRVFEPYFTTRSGRLGVGLTLASGIVRAHRGRIRIVGVEPCGAEVTVELPALVE